METPYTAPSSASNQDLQLTPLIRALLRKRGLEDEEAIRSFLKPSYELDLADPFLMIDMDKAVARIQQAITRKEKVAVYGDYDVDGIVSTALALELLEAQGLNPISYIPDRYSEGYGLHIAALEQLKKQGVTLIVSVDCGITATEAAAWAQQNNIDLIITDHHEVPAELPQALAVVNPKRPSDQYPFKELAGVGVVFALVRALQQRTGLPEKGREKWMLDLVAIGTVCDVMPLVGENRVLVKYGLIVLQKTKRVGLVALAQSADIDLAAVRAYHLGFVFGPRLNAAGRLEHANYGLELMVTSDPIVAQQMAFHLEELNHQRRLEQDRVLREADAAATERPDDAVLVLADPGWPHGVVGIVASKLAEKWQRPALVLQDLGDGKLKGSGRSYGLYSLITALRANEELFDRLGGHDFAAGFTLPAANLELLRQGLQDHYQTFSLAEDRPAAREADAVIDSATDVNWELLSQLELLEPFGNGNPQPLFELGDIKIIDVMAIGKDRQHLKLRLAAEEGGILEAIGFNLAEKYPNIKAGQTVNVQHYIEKNQFQGRTQLQLVLVAIQ